MKAAGDGGSRIVKPVGVPTISYAALVETLKEQAAVLDGENTGADVFAEEEAAFVDLVITELDSTDGAIGLHTREEVDLAREELDDAIDRFDRASGALELSTPVARRALIKTVLKERVGERIDEYQPMANRMAEFIRKKGDGKIIAMATLVPDDVGAPIPTIQVNLEIFFAADDDDGNLVLMREFARGWFRLTAMAEDLYDRLPVAKQTLTAGGGEYRMLLEFDGRAKKFFVRVTKVLAGNYLLPRGRVEVPDALVREYLQGQRPSEVVTPSCPVPSLEAPFEQQGGPDVNDLLFRAPDDEPRGTLL